MEIRVSLVKDEPPAGETVAKVHGVADPKKKDSIHEEDKGPLRLATARNDLIVHHDHPKIET